MYLFGSPEGEDCSKSALYGLLLVGLKDVDRADVF